MEELRKIFAVAFALLLLALAFCAATVQQQATVTASQPALQTQKAPVTWAKTYGNTSDEMAISVAATPDGGCILAGKTNSFGAGSYDFWVLKLDSNGTIQWQKTYGGSGEDVAYSVAVADDGYVVAGYTNSFGAGSYDFWVLKLNSTGDVVWQKTYGGSGIDVAFSVAFDLAGDERHIVVAGETTSSGAGGYDFLVLRLNSSTGEPLWNYKYGGSSDDLARSVAFAGDGYVVAGHTQFFGGDQDVWVLKLNMDGSLQWQNVYKNTGDDYAFSVAACSDGYIVAGRTNHSGDWNGDYDFLLLKLNSTGEIQWAKKYGRPGVEWAMGVAVGGDGYVVAGYTNSFGAGGYDFLVMKVDQTGYVVWQKTYGGLKHDEAYGVAVHADGYITVVGTTESFGAGNYDFWALRLNGSGAIANPISDFTIRDGSAEAEQMSPTNQSTSVSGAPFAVIVNSGSVSPNDTNAVVGVQAPPTSEGGVPEEPGEGAPSGLVEGWMVAVLLLVSGAGAPSRVWLVGAGVALAIVAAGALLFWRYRRVKS